MNILNTTHFIQKQTAVNKEIQQLRHMIKDQNKIIENLTERVVALEEAAKNKQVVENDETLGSDKLDQENTEETDAA
jgi:cell division protein FtsL